MGAHRHGLRRLSSGRRSSAIPFNLDQTAAVVTLLVVGSWVIVPAFALEASPAQRAKAVVLDAPPKWAPSLMNAARDRALAPVFVSEGVKSTFGLRKRVKGATIERRRGRDAETILEREGGTKLVVVAAGLGDDVSKALVRAATAAEAFGKAVRDTTTRLVIAVPDATELMNRAFAAFAYTLEGGGAALVANVPYAASREAALAVVDAAPRVAEAAPTAAPVWLVALLALALGLALGRQERYREAKRAFTQANDKKAAANNLGWVYYLNGDYERALRWYEFALLQPGDGQLTILENIETASRALEQVGPAAPGAFDEDNRERKVYHPPVE